MFADVEAQSAPTANRRPAKGSFWLPWMPQRSPDVEPSANVLTNEEVLPPEIDRLERRNSVKLLADAAQRTFCEAAFAVFTMSHRAPSVFRSVMSHQALLCFSVGDDSSGSTLCILPASGYARSFEDRAAAFQNIPFAAMSTSVLQLLKLSQPLHIACTCRKRILSSILPYLRQHT